MMKLSFNVFVIVSFLVTFGKKIGFSRNDFSSATYVYGWIKFDTLDSRSTIFLAGLWWVWRHRNLVCLNYETWSLTRLCNNFHSSTGNAISLGFERDGSAAHSDLLIKWNNSNHFGSILNVMVVSSAIVHVFTS